MVGFTKDGVTKVIQYFHTLLRYNQWANRLLFEACTKLSSDEYIGKNDMYFGSIHSCLNHVLLVDQLWKARAQGRAYQPSALDQVLYPDLNSLEAARGAQDESLLAWVERLSNEDLEKPITYHAVARQEKVQTRTIGQILLHLTQHQTHHRGQIHNQFGHLNHRIPELDLIYFYAEEDQANQ
ncbi:MAG: hypothetical protein A2527_14665 [Candidatus Lambdaproteobacteria bacterium RIFOXYD2_FULL_50_16]|uniref:Damage-inducible protein DinB n=1 Tax=Candidatus Lambdaproteobacteria bacterium RIFOXYD2_FULL_50_16 TaxID=1817772 RepID=A0A1F6G862_9PROT|nr:MAG: hypothetical protein A2527_14665 [Candidatus Lambdaproteobacteria bacterium RIFOXYD2_FULL_50_16]